MTKNGAWMGPNIIIIIIIIIIVIIFVYRWSMFLSQGVFVRPSFKCHKEIILIEHYIIENPQLEGGGPAGYLQS